MPDVQKRYDCGTQTDRHGRVVGHFGAGHPDCKHCQIYPFVFPPDGTWSLVSDRTLDALEQRASKQIQEAEAALGAIRAERSARSVTDA